jgi:predicted DNA-binding transcriptional regulator AlpA
MRNKRTILGDRPPAYCSKATLAAELDLSESTIDEYVKRGILPKPIEVGSLVRWRWDVVDASLASLAPGQALGARDPFLMGLDNVETKN